MKCAPAWKSLSKNCSNLNCRIGRQIQCDVPSMKRPKGSDSTGVNWPFGRCSPGALYPLCLSSSLCSGDWARFSSCSICQIPCQVLSNCSIKIQMLPAYSQHEADSEMLWLQLSSLGLFVPHWDLSYAARSNSSSWGLLQVTQKWARSLELCLPGQPLLEKFLAGLGARQSKTSWEIH